MKDIFLADAHLLHPEDENYRRLLEFLEKHRGEIRTLYLLGDLFEFWIGYRHAVFANYVPFLEALRRLRQAGTEIVYVEGNHDFHMGPFFERVLGCRILTEGATVEIDGRRVFIAHGDLANPDDSGYRLLRHVLRSRPLRALMAVIPPDWAWVVARWMSRQSDKSHAAKRARWIPEKILREFARRKFAEGNDVVVLGHFHAPHYEHLSEGTLVALGDWIDQYSYAVCAAGEFTLLRL